MGDQTTMNLCDRPVAQDHIHCVTCQTAVPLFEVFNAWEIPGADREACPRCFGAMLSPLAPA